MWGRRFAIHEATDHCLLSSILPTVSHSHSGEAGICHNSNLQWHPFAAPPRAPIRMNSTHCELKSEENERKSTYNVNGVGTLFNAVTPYFRSSRYCFHQIIQRGKCTMQCTHIPYTPPDIINIYRLHAPHGLSFKLFVTDASVERLCRAMIQTLLIG